MAKEAAPAPPKPKPDYKAPTPDPEDFAAWCEHPVTRFVALAHEIAAEKQKSAWIEETWRDGIIDTDKHLLCELRTRADAYMAFLETGLEDYERIIE